MRLIIVLIASLSIAGTACAQDQAPQFTSVPRILVRSPEPTKLAEFYKALGFVEARRSEFAVSFYLEGNVGVLEVLKRDIDTPPSGPKQSRTQQGVVAIFETTDQAGVIARAKAAGATLIEKWDAPDRPISIYYIADPENNILGFASRHHNPKIKTP